MTVTLWRTDVPKIADCYMQGSIGLDSLITRILPFKQINHGFELMGNGASIRRVLVY